MRRREFISLIGGAAIAYPLAARAQQPARIRRVGVLMNLSENDVEAQRLITAFREGLTQLGWVDGRNLRMDYRWAGGDIGRIRAFAKELVELSPDIIVAYATPSVVALQQQTQSVPIVFLSVTDPVGQGLVSSLAHPGGNITGFSVFEFSLGTKWIEALKQVAPNLKRVTTIFNPKTAPYYRLYLSTIEKAASSLDVQLCFVENSRQRWGRTGYECFGARARQRPDCYAGQLQYGPSPNNHRSRGPTSPAGHLLLPTFCGRRRVNFIWT